MYQMQPKILKSKFDEDNRVALEALTDEKLCNIPGVLARIIVEYAPIWHVSPKYVECDTKVNGWSTPGPCKQCGSVDTQHQLAGFQYNELKTYFGKGDGIPDLAFIIAHTIWIFRFSRFLDIVRISHSVSTTERTPVNMQITTSKGLHVEVCPFCAWASSTGTHHDLCPRRDVLDVEFAIAGMGPTRQSPQITRVSAVQVHAALRLMEFNIPNLKIVDWVTSS
jgi:hypothetical protein